MAAGAVGASAIDAVEEMLFVFCLPVTLGLRRIDPVLDRVGGGGGWMATRVLPPLWVTLDCCSTILLSTIPFASNILPWPVGDGNCVNLNSVDADSKLLWRSSKLTEGRKS